MRNLFKRKEHVAEVIEAISEAGTVTPPQPRVEQPAYQVGITESGKITLRIGGEWSGGMLTMNTAVVCKLIDMLEAALDAAAFEHAATEGHDGRGPG
jgi:hypothetical protein